MKINKNYFIVFLISTLLLACTESTSKKIPPRITAQGFNINDIQKGTVSDFGNIKLRIESDGRIQKLYIKERSYEVDLATTPERSHFSLFGLEKRAYLHTDVTLDFKNYINKKINQTGEYVFNIEVVDKDGNPSTATLNIHLSNPKDTSAPIETGEFLLQRKGAGNVRNGEIFGITWKTIDKIKVTIRVTKAEGGASKLTRFNLFDYEQIASKQALTKKMYTAKDMNEIVFDTTNNSASGEVLGISIFGKNYLLKTEKSNTTLAHAGTIVTLNGSYKF